MIVDPEEDALMEEASSHYGNQLVGSNMVTEIVDGNILGLGEDTLARVKGYRDVVTGVFGQLERTARAQDL